MTELSNNDNNGQDSKFISAARRQSVVYALSYIYHKSSNTTYTGV